MIVLGYPKLFTKEGKTCKVGQADFTSLIDAVL